MAPTFPIVLEDIGLAPFSATIKLPKIESRNYTVTAGIEEVQVYGDGPIRIELTWPPLDRDEAAELIAFQLQLNAFGGGHTFLAGEPAGASPRGVASGVPLVMGAGQTGNVLSTQGWAANTANILRKFSWLQLGSGSAARLYCVIEDADSDAGGFAELSIWPALRESPPDDEPIILNSPKGKFRLVEPDIEYTIDAAMLYGVTLQGIEAL